MAGKRWRNWLKSMMIQQRSQASRRRSHLLFIETLESRNLLSVNSPTGVGNVAILPDNTTNVTATGGDLLVHQEPEG